jgi:hypothetical protein
MLAASLPFLGRSLPVRMNAVVPQLCLNLESLVLISAPNCPPDYLITELEALTALCHYVLIDSSSGIAPALAGSAGLLSGLSPTGTNGNNGSTSNNQNGQILHNLVHAFTPGVAGAPARNDMSFLAPMRPVTILIRQRGEIYYRRFHVCLPVLVACGRHRPPRQIVAQTGSVRNC